MRPCVVFRPPPVTRGLPRKVGAAAGSIQHNAVPPRTRTPCAPLFAHPHADPHADPLAPGFAWDSTPLATLLVDLDGAILAANAAAGRLAGVAPAAIPGAPIDRLVPALGAAWPSLVDAVRREGPQTGAVAGEGTEGRRTLAFALSLAETAHGVAVQVFVIDAALRGAAPLVASPVAGARKPAGPLASLRVLVIDDEPLVRTTVCRLLERRGAVVVTAENGVEGEARLRDARFDLIVCDVSMPGPSGHEVLALARVLCPEVPFILMSGYTGRLRREGSVVEPDMILEKPFTAKVLDAAIDGALRRTGAAAPAAVSVAG